ncbi:hypothetical protein BD770DRAFT_473409 [Pilaira anomala]|nr:hypothetical protein BD770DRAFT_473409 [Pilaira anomala]
MAGGVAMTGAAMKGVAMIGIALTNTGAALIVVVMMAKILLFVVCWNLKAKGKNGCYYGNDQIL